MAVNNTATQCVNANQLVILHVGMSFQSQRGSRYDKTRIVALEIWSYAVFKVQDENVKLEASMKQAESLKLTPSLMKVFVLTATLFFKKKRCSYSICPSQEVRSSLAMGGYSLWP